MGVERRKDQRVRCSIPCQVSACTGAVDGTVRDVSAGGLSVQVDMDVDQGDVVSVLLQPKRREAIPVQAIVWHHRRVKQKRTGEVSSRLGLVLSDAPEDFGDLLGLPSAPPPKAKSESEPKPLKSAARSAAAAKPKKAAPAGLPKPDRYRIRVKMDAGPRTRSILVFARDEDEARQGALAETGAGWSILEAERA